MLTPYYMVHNTTGWPVHLSSVSSTWLATSAIWYGQIRPYK